jgi:hypothetical protein
MEKHDVGHLEARVKELSYGLANLADDKDFQELLRLFRKPGWTTPAEFVFAAGVVDAMLAQMKTLAGLKHVLLTGSQAVIAQ